MVSPSGIRQTPFLFSRCRRFRDRLRLIFAPQIRKSDLTNPAHLETKTRVHEAGFLQETCEKEPHEGERD